MPFVTRLKKNTPTTLVEERSVPDDAKIFGGYSLIVLFGCPNASKGRDDIRWPAICARSKSSSTPARCCASSAAI